MPPGKYKRPVHTAPNQVCLYQPFAERNQVMKPAASVRGQCIAANACPSTAIYSAVQEMSNRDVEPTRRAASFHVYSTTSNLVHDR